MIQRQAPLLLGLLAVALLLRGPAKPSGTPPADGSAAASLPSAVAATGADTAAPAPAGAAAAQPPAVAAWREYARLYREVLNVPPPQPAASGETKQVRGRLMAQPVSLDISVQPKPAPVTDQDLSAIRASAKNCHLEYMIALVADPIDSRLAVDFDLALIALQRGLADSKYRLVRKWLPWTDSDAADQKQYRGAAGMMLFRYSEPNPKGSPQPEDQSLLAVFVVGETPKLGIHKLAFESAVDFIQALHPPVEHPYPQPAQRHRGAGDARRLAAAGPPPFEIPVLGPTFSGSADSLRLAIAAAPPAACFRIVSGSAAAPDLETRMRAGALCDRVRFSRTLVDEVTLASTALRFLQDKMGWDLHRTALLIEYDTVYGGALLESPSVPPLLKLTFPSGLFALRNAWEEAGFSPPAHDLAAKLKAIPRSKTTLDVSLKDQGTPIDVVPELSPLTSRIGDMAAANLLREISRSRISYVGILATDIKDEMFLAEQIRRWAPGVVLFVFDDNLLYIHPQYNATMFGTLAISSYPLAPEGERQPLSFATPFNYRRQFASALQEGTYLAVATLLGKPIAAPAVWIAACGNYEMSPLAKLWPNFAPAQPPAWTSAVERLGPRARTEPALAAPAATRSPGRTSVVERLGRWLRVRDEPALAAPPPTWPPGKAKLQPLLLIIVLGAASYALRKAAFFGWVPLDPRAAPSRECQSRESDSSAATPRQPLHDLASRALGKVVAYLGGAPLNPTAPVQTHHLLCVGTALLGLGAVGVLGVAWPPESGTWAILHLMGYLYLAWVLFQTTHLYDGRRVARWGSLAAGLALPLLVGWLAFRLWQVDGYGFFRLRARTFSGGLSPLVPLGWLLAAVLFWIFIELKRRLVRERHRTSWPFYDGPEPSRAGREEARRIDRVVDQALPPGPWCLAPLAVMIATVLGVWTTMQPIGENRVYGRIFLAIWAVIAVLGLESFVRFLEAWYYLQRMLRCVEQSGLLEVLKKIGSEVGWKPMAFTWYVPSFSTLKATVDRLQRLIGYQMVPEVTGPPAPSDLFVQIQKMANRRRYSSIEVALQNELESRFKRADRRLATQRHELGIDDYYAARLIAYLRQIFNQLRYFVVGTLGTGLAVVVAIITFAFEPRQLLMLCLATILLGVSTSTAVVFVQMERDATLCAIGGTEAGKITFNWTFFSKMLTYAVLPALTLAAGQFPSIGRLLSGWFEPLARLLRAG